jgi:subtilisin family serine protease
MPTFRYGGRDGVAHELTDSHEHVVVRTANRQGLFGARPFETAQISPDVRLLLSRFELVTRFREVGVELLRVKPGQDSRVLRDDARSVLNAEEAVQFAGRVLLQGGQPVVYTENLFIKFHNQVQRSQAEALLTRHSLQVKQRLDYATNAYFVSAPIATGQSVFDLAETLLMESTVELCHPELVREVRQRQAFAPQWHLKETTINGKVIKAHANVEAAWLMAKGDGVTIAIVDDGIDIDHEEFRSSGKIVAPRNVSRKTDDPRPGSGDNHGTACAGVACANGNYGASGVAPNAKLMPIRLSSGLGSQAEADAFVWAARNGADIISCSWGPPDGVWYDPKDAGHNQVIPLPDSTRLAIDYALTNGRNGKGCVVMFAAGNGNESVDNDGYASNPKIIAVAACNDMGVRSAYSDFGKAVWCSFPSNNGRPSLTPGVWTTDRTGNSGYNPGKAEQGDASGNYTNSFGGTSSACPGVAGVAALILSRNPELRSDEVKDVLKRCCDRIDEPNGKYDATGRSPLYGYGRVNALKAVELASKPAQPAPLVVVRVVQDVQIQDLKTVMLGMVVAETRPIKKIRVVVDVEHSYIGDLIVSIKPPDALCLAPIVLHDRGGGSTDDIKRAFDAVNVPGVAVLHGKSPQGGWMLLVEDKAQRDTGMIKGFSLEMEV